MLSVFVCYGQIAAPKRTVTPSAERVNAIRSSASALSGGCEQLYRLWLSDLSTTARSQSIPRTYNILGQPQQVYPINHTDYLHCFLFVKESFDPQPLTDMGVLIQSAQRTLLNVLVPMERLPEVASVEGVVSIELSKRAKPTMNKGRSNTQVDKVRLGTGLNSPYTSKGVIVGIVDVGFDFTHPALYSTDQSQYRVSRVWDQLAEGTAPQGFDYGAEFVGKEAILAAQHDQNEESSHGIHVAGIAAGAYATSPLDYSGNAPEAELVLVASNGDESKLFNALEYIFNYADEVDKPCVVNFSWGDHSGPHDGTSPFDSLVDQRTRKEGGDKIHIGQQFGEMSDTIRTIIKEAMQNDHLTNTADSLTNTADSLMWMNIWGTEGKEFEISISLIDTSTHEIVDYLPYIKILDNSQSEIEYQLYGTTTGGEKDTTKIHIERKASYPNNKKPFAIIEVHNTKRSQGSQVPSLEIVSKECRIDLWGYKNCEFTNKIYTEFRDGDSEYSVGEIGGTGKNTISVGAYTTKNEYIDLQGRTQAAPWKAEEEGMLAPFSSHGPTVDERMKPDIAAPGNVLISSVNRFDTKNYGPNSIETVLMVEEEGTKWYYGSMQGTSMASPFMTGVVATWLQADPTLTPDKIKAVIEETATQDRFTTNKNEWGYGKINAYKGIQQVLQATGIEDNTTTQPSITLHRGTITLRGMAQGTTVSVYTTEGTCVLQSTWNGTPIPFSSVKGIYVIKAGNCIQKVAE